MSIEDILAPYKPNDKKLISRLEQILSRFKKSGITTENITTLLMMVMMETKRLKTLKSFEKKQLTVNLMTYLVDEIIPGDDVPLELILKQMVPTLIDNLSDVMNLKQMSCCIVT